MDKPSLTIRLADQAKANGTAVIVCPGGGYGALAMDHEGKQIADWLNNMGVSAFILKYRLGPNYHHPAPLMDAQRAIRTCGRGRGNLASTRSDRNLGVFGRWSLGIHHGYTF